MKEAEDIIAAEVRGLRLDCAPGCQWCCHQLVVMTAVADGEAILAAARAAMTEAEFTVFEGRVRDQAAEVARLPYGSCEVRRWPCPLLTAAGQCAVYAVRPVACRSVMSTDAGCCRAMYETMDYDALTPAHQRLAAEMGERATRIQLTVNFRRPMDGVFELRELLVALLDRDAGPGGNGPGGLTG